MLKCILGCVFLGVFRDLKGFVLCTGPHGPNQVRKSGPRHAAETQKTRISVSLTPPKLTHCDHFRASGASSGNFTAVISLSTEGGSSPTGCSSEGASGASELRRALTLLVFGIPIFGIPAFGIPVFGISYFGIPGFGISASGRVPV